MLYPYYCNCYFQNRSAVALSFTRLATRSKIQAFFYAPTMPRESYGGWAGNSHPWDIPMNYQSLSHDCWFEKVSTAIKTSERKRPGTLPAHRNRHSNPQALAGLATCKIQWKYHHRHNHNVILVMFTCSSNFTNVGFSEMEHHFQIFSTFSIYIYIYIYI